MMNLGPYLTEEYITELAARKWWKKSSKQDKIRVLIADKVPQKKADAIAQAESWSDLDKENQKHIIKGMKNLRWI